MSETKFKRSQNTNGIRLGDEDRRLMHLVPAPAVRLMKRRVLSRPGVNRVRCEAKREKRKEMKGTKRKSGTVCVCLFNLTALLFFPLAFYNGMT
ncbi:hypothetical protein AWC38_SpisGene22765 [Stylophora pistillata]|uniref:Transmembrane protein n=1 Tax=Stylophora pistillata TaxID=50429 RepID=A0A2B4R9Y5_STYPI|nr:hypothetical protein AWC38_SpisGene22765 [Stylophora pistillata]